MLCANVSEYVFPAHLSISILFTYWQEKDSEKDLQNKVYFNKVFSKAKVLVPKAVICWHAFRR